MAAAADARAADLAANFTTHLGAGRGLTGLNADERARQLRARSLADWNALDLFAGLPRNAVIALVSHLTMPPDAFTLSCQLAAEEAETGGRVAMVRTYEGPRVDPRVQRLLADNSAALSNITFSRTQRRVPDKVAAHISARDRLVVVDSVQDIELARKLRNTAKYVDTSRPLRLLLLCNDLAAAARLHGSEFDALWSFEQDGEQSQLRTLDPASGATTASYVLAVDPGTRRLRRVDP